MMKSNLFIYMYKYYPLMINLFMIFFLCIPFKFMKFNPINLILILISLTTMISLKMNLMINSWTSFLLFLIMIGGLMIIFMYITSLSNNELFKLNYKIILINFLKIIFLILILIMLYYNMFNWNNSNTWYNSFIYNYNLNFYKMLSKYYFNKTIFIMIYLFYSMICIMNICYKFKSPLRQLIY